MPQAVTVQDLYTSLRKSLTLEWVAENNGRDRILFKSASALSVQIIAGLLNYIHPARIQIIGPTEQKYLKNLTKAELNSAMDRLYASEPAAILLVDNVKVIDSIANRAEKHHIPLLSSPLTDKQVLDNLQYYASRLSTDKKILHGVFLEVLGMGVLVTGGPAVGKSELALELITRGHRLVADDAPEFSRIAPDIISGSCPPLLRDYLEVRGLGILDIRSMFGDSTIKHNKYLRLIVHLKRMTQKEIATMDRLTGTHTKRDILGVLIPEVTVPVAPGRNLAILVETAVRNHLLRLKGYDAAKSFIRRQQREILRQP